MKLSLHDIESRFGFHKATIEGADATVPKHTDLRAKFKAFAADLEDLLPEGRYKSLFQNELENASMWAHKALAEVAPILDEADKVVDENTTPAPTEDAPQETPAPVDPTVASVGMYAPVSDDPAEAALPEPKPVDASIPPAAQDAPSA